MRYLLLQPGALQLSLKYHPLKLNVKKKYIIAGIRYGDTVFNPHLPAAGPRPTLLTFGAG
jgi:hypothetical protein